MLSVVISVSTVNQLSDTNSTANYAVQREFDRLGRPRSIAYGAPSVTPDVLFTYDDAGNRVKMSEYGAANFTGRVRETTFGYDDVRRMTSAAFDNDGNSTADQTVTYQYDAGGLRTRLTMPDSLNVTYTYDAKGRLISLTDWDDQASTFAYDNAGRHVATERANGLRTRYDYDAGGRLRLLRHTKDGRTLANFAYEVDKRGNRTQAAEMLAQPATTNDVTIASTDKGIIVSGVWADVSGFKESSAITASLLMGFVGDEATLTMGTGPDHGIYDIYIDGSLWQSFDGYAAAAGERNIVIPSSIDTGKLSHDGPHGLEIHVRAERHPSATGNKVRFKQLVIADRGYTLHTIRYSYDKLARVRDARYAPGLNGSAADADLQRRYQYAFDLSGNRTQEIETIAGSATTTNYGYNAANQMTSAGATTLTYDNNGNLLGDGTNTYAWDRANRMRAVNEGDVSQRLLTYDGLGNFVQQVTGTINPTTHSYLVDVNTPLPVVVREQASYYNPNDNYTRHQIHGPRGIHYHEQVGPYIPSFPDPIMLNTQAWMLQDGLGSVRGAADPTGATVWSTNYVPFGEMFGAAGTTPTSYGFTGERYSAPDLVYLRARHYNPTLGIFAGLDPFEGIAQRPMSLNGYSWVEGNVINVTDMSGMSPLIAKIINNGLCAVSGSVNSGENSCVCYCNPLFEDYSPYMCTVCNAFNEGTGVYADGSQFVYCDGAIPDQRCCGPDITSWLMRELQIHGSYAATPGVFMPSNFVENAFGQAVFKLAVYGLAVDYGNVDYRALASASMQQYNPSNTDYSCSSSGVVTICGHCQNSTDLGNFILGYSIARSGVGQRFAELAGPIFNLLSGDTSAGADNLGVEIGYRFAQMGQTSDTPIFCALWESLGTEWHDGVPVSGCSTPCRLQNLDCAANSIPDWNGFVSTSLGGAGRYITPLEELISRGFDFVTQ